MKIEKRDWMTALTLGCLLVWNAAAQTSVTTPGRGVAQSNATELTKFDLDFPGGGPKELVRAIEKARGKPLNAIVRDDLADIPLPALRMNNVDVSSLFSALFQSTMNTKVVRSGASYQHYQFSAGFRSLSSPSNPINDDTIWTFYAEGPPKELPRPRVCKFYSLTKYLETGITVDDITTAIKTGAKMLGEGEGPTISFHKDTKLLIGVGEPANLEIIDAVLRALEPEKQKPAEKKSEAKSQ